MLAAIVIALVCLGAIALATLLDRRAPTDVEAVAARMGKRPPAARDRYGVDAVSLRRVAVPTIALPAR